MNRMFLLGAFFLAADVAANASVPFVGSETLKLLSDLTSNVVLYWVVYYTLGKAFPNIIKENREDQKAARGEYQAELQAARADYKESLAGILAAAADAQKTLLDNFNNSLAKSDDRVVKMGEMLKDAIAAAHRGIDGKA